MVLGEAFTKRLVLLFLCLFGGYISGQDLRLFTIASPSSGCNLGNQESVSVVIINVGPALNNATFDATFILDGGAPVTENIVLPPVFNNGSLITYTFSTTGDFSIPGNHSLTSYIDLPGDVNRTNDTISNFIITSDPLSVGGTVTGTATVCSGSNSGTLVLSGETGLVQRWESSPDGSIWTPISNTTTSQTYSGLTSTTYYRAVVKSGTCAEANSTAAIITIDPVSVGGTISGSDTVCSGSSGALTLQGFTGAIQQWEFSTDNGSNWTTISNTTSTQNYTSITTNTLFRAQVKSGMCPAAYSSNGSIGILPASAGGTTTGSTAVCAGVNSGVINLSGNIGTVLRWEKSTDGGSTWTNVSNTTGSLSYSNLSVTTQYRAISENCPPEQASTISIITVDQPPVAGTVTSDTTVCASSNSGIITLTGSSGTVAWESSTDGITWNAIAGTSTSNTFNSLSSNTYFRAVLSSGVCNAVTSNSILVTVNSASDGGELSGDTSVCITGQSGYIVLNGFNSQILNWQVSQDLGATWTSISNTDDSLFYLNLNNSSLYRAEVKNGVCPAAYSDSVLITVDSTSIAGVVSLVDTACVNTDVVATLSGSRGSVTGWFTSNDSINWNPSGSSSSLTLNSIQSSTYVLAIVKNGACPADTSVAEKVSVLTLNANAGADTSITEGGSVTLTGAGGLTFNWSPASTLSDANISNPVATPTETTTYQLTVSNSFGCSATDEVIVTVNDSIPGPGPEIQVTNFISPNGDGINDFWVVKNIASYESSVMIFSSDGQKLFESSPYLNDWNAQYNGTTVPDGTYYYILLIGSAGSETKLTGNITVLTKP